jgi:hypothetical protein
MSEFEVGDRVRFTCYDENVGPVTIEKINGSFYEFSDGTFAHGRDWMKKNTELISKGSESTMENVDAIAVEVDDEYMSHGIQQKAFDENYKWLSGSTNYQESDKLYFNRKEQQLYRGTTEKRRYKNLGKLSKNWNKVVEFLEQEDETFEINGHEVEVEESSNFAQSKVKIGCWSEQAGVIEHLVGDLERIGTMTGEITVEGEDITIEQMIELRDWLQNTYKEAQN